MTSTGPLRGVRVLVAGAGLAGLAAARDLTARGAEVCVIDARNRAGGRVWTIRDAFRHRQHAEGGADLIDSDQTAVVTLARDLGLTLERILKTGWGYRGIDRQGRVSVQRIERGFESAWGPLAELIAAYKLTEQRWDGAIAQEMARQSAADWLRAIHAAPGLRSRFLGLRGLFLADPEELSLLAVVDFFATGSFGEGHTLRVKGGNDRIATKMAEQLASPVRLRTILRSVRQDSTGVVARVDDASGAHEIKADYLVAAMPATTLRDVEWDGAVPDVQREAFSRLRSGAATRLLVQFKERFWKKRGRPNAFGSDQPTGAVWDGNEEQPGRAGILSFVAGGGASAELQQILAEGGIEGVVPRMAWLGRPADVLASHTIVWEDDPWARGGYAFFDPSFDPALRDWLARPAGRVLFAGEHTSIRWQGYMNGAVESGQRAAREIVAIDGTLREAINVLVLPSY